MKYNVTIEKEVEDRDTWSCLSGAFEGGSGYWARSSVTNHAGCARINHGDPLIKEENARRLVEHKNSHHQETNFLPYGKKCEEDFDWLRENKRYIYHHQIPFLGGEITIYDLESREWSEEKDDWIYAEVLGVVNQQTIESGLQTMSESYQRHFEDFVSESGDAITSDVMLQCITMGKVVFG